MAGIFDQAHFDAMTGGDRGLQAEVIELFRGQAAKSVAALEAMPVGEAWRDAAHTLKGSARGLGLWALAETCESAERLPGDGGALEAVRAALTMALEALAVAAREQSAAQKRPV